MLVFCPFDSILGMIQICRAVVTIKTRMIYKKMFWQFQFNYDNELGYFYTSSMSVEQCGPYEIQKDSDFIKRLILKYGEPVKVDFNNTINSLLNLNNSIDIFKNSMDILFCFIQINYTNIFVD